MEEENKCSICKKTAITDDQEYCINCVDDQIEAYNKYINAQKWGN